MFVLEHNAAAIWQPDIHLVRRLDRAAAHRCAGFGL
jgi:hypothetical protein